MANVDSLFHWILGHVEFLILVSITWLIIQMTTSESVIPIEPGTSLFHQLKMQGSGFNQLDKQRLFMVLAHGLIIFVILEKQDKTQIHEGSKV